MKVYIHTINRQPAEYDDGSQIVYGSRRIKAVSSLKEIRKQQKASEKWRTSQGYGVDEDIMGHIIVDIPEEKGTE